MRSSDSETRYVPVLWRETVPMNTMFLTCGRVCVCTQRLGRWMRPDFYLNFRLCSSFWNWYRVEREKSSNSSVLVPPATRDTAAALILEWLGLNGTEVFLSSNALCKSKVLATGVVEGMEFSQPNRQCEGSDRLSVGLKLFLRWGLYVCGGSRVDLGILTLI